MRSNKQQKKKEIKMTSTNFILTVILRLQSNLQFPNKLRPTYDCVLCSCVFFSNPQFCFTLQDIPKNSIVIIIVDAVIHMSRNGYYSKISKKKRYNMSLQNTCAERYHYMTSNRKSAMLSQVNHLKSMFGGCICRHIRDWCCKTKSTN